MHGKFTFPVCVARQRISLFRHFNTLPRYHKWWFKISVEMAYTISDMKPMNRPGVRQNVNACQNTQNPKELTSCWAWLMQRVMKVVRLEGSHMPTKPHPGPGLCSWVVGTIFHGNTKFHNSLKNLQVPPPSQNPFLEPRLETGLKSGAASLLTFESQISYCKQAKHKQ